MTPSPRIRHWFPFSASAPADASTLSLLTGWELQRRFRPQVLILEDRNAPGSLLSELFADALTAALMPPTPGHEARPGDVEPRREVLRFWIPGGEPPAPAPLEALRGGAETGQAGGVVSVRDADEPAFFWLPEPTTNASLPFIHADPIAVPRHAADLNAPVSTGTGNGVRVPIRQLPASLSGASFAALPSTPDEVTPNSTDSSFRVQNEAEPDPDEPPNTAPILVDDAGTLDEDGFVVINITSNDTDADGDALRVDGWDAEPANGTLQLNPDGTLTYTPFRDYSGSETFTVNVTDGEAVVTSNVAVTVNPVNDAPMAFHDGFAYRNLVADGKPLWPAGDPYPYVERLTGSILANDYDVDGTLMTVGALNMSSTVGTVTVDTVTGTFTWVGPWDFIGETSFAYRSLDAGGALSDWATVRLWVVGEPISPSIDGDPRGGGDIPEVPAVAEDDIVAVGDTEGTDNVMLNDPDAFAVVVVSHPTSTRLTGFDFDGSVAFRPGVPRSDSGFTYRLFSPGGERFIQAQVTMPVVQLDIFNGQGAKTQVSDETDYTTGAFTVANLNDTDGDTIKDFEDVGGVRAAHGVGKDEVDLMKLVINKPTTFGANDSLTVDVTAGSARFYNGEFREGTSLTSLTLTSNDFVLTTSAIYWVEAYFPSAAIRDINIRMTYRGQSETVRATGVWANITYPSDIRTGGNTPDSDGNDPDYTNLFQRFVVNVSGGTLGLSPVFADGLLYTPVQKARQPAQPPYMKYQFHLSNNVDVGFTITPPGLLTEPLVRFDVSRSVHAATWTQVNGKQPAVLVAVNPQAYRDQANDDRTLTGEDNTPKNDRIISMDTPGLHPYIQLPQYTSKNYALGNADRVVQRMNAWEFVRIKVDGSKFTHIYLDANGNPIPPQSDQGNLQGSRGSEHVPWRSRLEFTWDSTTKVWVRTANTDPAHPVNYIGAHHDDLTTPAI